jgi:hypothetical protein
MDAKADVLKDKDMLNTYLKIISIEFSIKLSKIRAI